MWRPVSRLNDQQLLAELSSTIPMMDSNEAFSDDTLDDDADEDAKVSEEDDDEVSEYTVVEGDTLLRILMQFGIQKSDIYLISRQHKQLTNLKIGQKISWQ